MPELPEVETVKRGLELLLNDQQELVVEIKKSKEKLRNPISLAKLNQVKDQRYISIFRKAKYLVFELNDFYLISHLGMTGSWRIEKDKRKHDHIQILLSSKRTLTYNDPRRFGVFDVIKKEDLNKDSRFVHLGPDPVLDLNFDGDYLFSRIKKSNRAIKSVIMDQTQVVGVGNIYASEALFLAGVNPFVLAKKISKDQCYKLVDAIKETLFDAIECGGTTISDFKQAGGESGYFQNLLLVYGRDKELCIFCQTIIKSQSLTGRNTFWCPGCQKK